MKKDKVFTDQRFEASPFGPPNGKGVYAICATKITYYPHQLKRCRVLYIGSSKNIRKRLSGTFHIYRRLYSICKTYSISCFYYECDDYLKEEKDLIKKFNPRFNIQFKD